MDDEYRTVQRRLRLLASHLIPSMPREDALLCLHKNGPWKERDDELVILNATKGKIGEVKDQATQKAMDTKEAIVNRAGNIKKKVEDSIVNRAGNIKKKVEDSIEQGKEYLQAAGHKLIQTKDTAVDKTAGAKDSAQHLTRDIRKKVAGETEDESNNSIKDTEKGQETSKGFLKNPGNKATESAKIDTENIVGRIEDMTNQNRVQVDKVVKAMENAHKKD